MWADPVVVCRPLCFCFRGDECAVGHSAARWHVTGGFRTRRSANNDTNNRFQLWRKQQSVRRWQSDSGREKASLGWWTTLIRPCSGEQNSTASDQNRGCVWNKIILKLFQPLKEFSILFQNYFSDTEYYGKYICAALSLWNDCANNFRHVSTRWNKIISEGHRQRLK